MVKLQPWSGYLNNGDPVEYPSYGCTIQECEELNLYMIEDRQSCVVKMGDDEMYVQRKDRRWHFRNLRTNERFCIRETLK